MVLSFFTSSFLLSNFTGLGIYDNKIGRDSGGEWREDMMLTEETVIKHFSFSKSLQGINLTLEKLLLHTLHIHCTRATCVGKAHITQT